MQAEMQTHAPTPEVDALLTDREAAAMLRVGATRWFEIQRRSDFPAPLWLGPRCKRHVRGELLAWAASQRRRPEGDAE